MPSVGIFFNARPDQGGLYQYALTLVHCLQRPGSPFSYRLYDAGLDPLPLEITAPNWTRYRLPRRPRQLRLGIEWMLLAAARAGLELGSPLVPPYPRIASDPPDLMLYVKPGVYPFQWPYPSIFPVHDLQHRLQPEFPEVSERGEFRRREYLYRNSLRVARAVLTDSETGRQDVLDCYGGDPGRIHPLPYIAPAFRPELASETVLARVRSQYGLPDRFLFYPAAFWPHKNHLRLLDALALVGRDGGPRLPLVLAGSRSRGYAEVARRAAELGLQDQVTFVGYVADEEIMAFYRLALALVMPTFFGPTNIPVLEAWQAGCPVITSDLRGIREQVGDAGLLVDPRDPAALARAIAHLHRDAELRATLRARGHRRAGQWTAEAFTTRLEQVLAAALCPAPPA